MLLSAKNLAGRMLHATDSVAGRVDQLLFDDITWKVRHIVVTIGGWLLGHSVLVPPSAVPSPGINTRSLFVPQTCAQLDSYPDLSTDPSVTYQHQLRALPAVPYWPCTLEPGFWAAGGYVGMLTDDPASENADTAGDPHLRGTRDVAGYRIVARDAPLGRASDWLIDDTTWSVRYLVITKRVWPWSERLLVAARDVRAIDWASRTVTIDRWREDVERSPVNQALAHG